MTPKQAAKSLVQYGKRHRELQTSSFMIPQVEGTIARSKPVRGVLESLIRSNTHDPPLISTAALRPYVGGNLAPWLSWP